jgi:DASS family divalent anion:Na+ symporter
MAINSSVSSRLAATSKRGPRQTKAGRWLIVLLPGLLLYFIPLPLLSAAQRHLLAIFAATIIALVAQPVPMGVSTTIAITLLALTKTVPINQIFSGYSNPTVWLIFTAFLFARAVTCTRFGMRVAYLFIHRFGRNSLALGYSIAASDLVLAPFIPSDTARGGGIICPVVQSISGALGSEPDSDTSAFGRFLTLVGYHTTYTASAMFLTGMAANPLIAEFARQVGNVNLTWTRWLAGSCVPGTLALVLLPWLIARLAPPNLSNTEAARDFAGKELRQMGPLSRDERWLVVIMLFVMAGWVTSPWHGISNTIVALAGVCALLVTNVISWNDLLDERRAWEALIWFGALLMMADNLLQSGVIAALSKSAFAHLQGWTPLVSLIALVLLYIYLHYGFASMTAQVTALYPSFLVAALAAGASPLVAAVSLAYFSNLNAAMTHYGTGSAPVYFGTGFVSQKKWWQVGFLISLVNVALWLGLGLLWWKLLGWW